MSVASTRPVLERICDILQSRVATLTTGIKPATPLVEVVRPTRIGDFTPKHMQVVLVLGDSAEAEDLYRPGNPPAIAYNQTVNLYCHIMPSEQDPTSLDEYASTMHADVIESITDAGADWHDFGGLAIDTQLGAVERISSDGSIDGIVIPLVITYRISEWSPYEVRY